MMLWLSVALAAAPGGALSAPSDDCSERSADEQKAFTEHLEELYQADLADALAISQGEKVKDQSVARAKEVLKLEGKGELCTGDDRFWGAMVLLQATHEDAAAMAYHLGEHLVQERYPRGPWLAAVAYDRWAVANGSLQFYGTQTRTADGKTCLYWVDPEFPDERRKSYGHPTFTETITKILEANGRGGDEATVPRLQHLDLWCKPTPWSGKRSDLQDPFAR